MEMGNKIRALRYKASMTQEELAEELGVSAQAVSKWENGVTMPDISLLPALAEVFGVSIDELFDLTAEQKLRRIENSLDIQEELEPDVFREYEEFLTGRLREDGEKGKVLSLLAQLYHHRLEACARRSSRYAREAIRLAPEKKDCQWLLQKAEGAAAWDWNVSNHAQTIEFYKSVVENDRRDPPAVLPYYDLMDNLIADHRAREAAAYLRRYACLPGHKPFLVPVYEAAIALSEYDAPRADGIMEKALRDFAGEPGMLFEAAQYYARKCDYDQAIRYYEASYAAEENKKPRFVDALQAIAMIREIRGDYRQAADTWRRVLDAQKTEWGLTEETEVQETERQIRRLEERERNRA